MGGTDTSTGGGTPPAWIQVSIGVEDKREKGYINVWNRY